MLLDPYIKDVVCAEINLLIIAIDSSNIDSRKKGKTVYKTMATNEP